MAPSSLVKKLLIKPGQRMLILNAPSGYHQALGELPEGVELTEAADGSFDFVQLFVANRAELDQHLTTATGAVKPEGLLWICYPKGSSKLKSDLNRDILWKAIEPLGLMGVTLIAIDETWSAMRFRPTDQVSSDRRKPPAS